MDHSVNFWKIISFLLVGWLLIACTSQAEISHSNLEAQSPTPAQTITLTDGYGRQIVLDDYAQKIISLAPSNTEILFAIGAGSQLVGRDSLSDYPTEAQQIKDIGGDFGELDEETMLTLEPDLVLASELTSREQIQALQDIGLIVFALANPLDLEGLYTNLATVAELTGHQQEAQELIEQLRGRVNAVETKIEQVDDRPLVYYELDGTDPNAPWTSGPGTFIDRLISMAGGENLGKVLTSEWAQISLEALIAQDPDIIILGNAHWGGVTPEMVAARTGWEALAAVRANKIFPFDDNLVSRPGPRLVEGLENLAFLLHPELFP